MVQRGLYVDAFKLDKSWSKARLYVELASLFKKALSALVLMTLGKQLTFYPVVCSLPVSEK